MRRAALATVIAALLSLFGLVGPTAAEELPPGFTDGIPVGPAEGQESSAGVPPAEEGPLRSTMAVGAAATTDRYFGQAPYNAVVAAVAAAPRPADCTIADHILTAMVLAPVFKESSAATTAASAPAPMTLSRYDEWSGTFGTTTNRDANYGLYAFQDPFTQYYKAYWHPGIGIWQYDSAGVGAPFTAIERMDAGIMARDVATGMAQRYCTTEGTPQTKRWAAWRPWGNPTCELCQTYFDEMMSVSPRLSNIKLVAGIELLGGVKTRTCRLAGSSETVTCWYVDPSTDVIQGAKAWATYAPDGNGSPTVQPAPLSSAFYVIDGGTYEERHWLSVDTGYDVDISASRPMGRNARPFNSPGLTWSASSGLCDLTAARGSCGSSELLPPTPLSRVDASRPAGAKPVVGDFDGDGLSDVVWYGAGSAPDALWLGRSGGTFDTLPLSVSGTYRPVVARLGPGPGHDVLWHVPSSGRVARFVYSNGSFSREEHRVPRDTLPLIGDFDADGRDEVLWYGKGDIPDVYWDVTASGLTVRDMPVRGAYLPRVGDFDGNGADDIFWYGPGAKPDSIWLHQPGGSRVQVVVNVKGNYKPVVGDFNGDGRADVFWYAAGPHNDTIWLGIDGRRWTARPTNVTGSYTMVVADADGDGSDELILYQPGTGSDHYWELDSTGRVSRKVSVRIGGVYYVSGGSFGSPAGGVLWAHTALDAVTIWTP